MSARTRHTNVWDVAIALVFIVVGVSLRLVCLLFLPVPRLVLLLDRRSLSED